LTSPVAQSDSSAHLAAEIVRTFRERFGVAPAYVFRAPGRVNLIGEHTDYNDGFVMPVAIEFATCAAVGPRSDNTLSVFASNFGEVHEFDLANLDGPPSRHWSDYVRGVAAVLQKRNVHLKGANLVIAGNVPIGSGLSSSAAFEVAAALVLLANSGAELPRADIALACQRAENDYTGARCGIMDQFVSCFGRADHAIMIDCRDLTHRALPLDTRIAIVVCNTKVSHSVAGGEYNSRRADCERSVRALQTKLPGIKALRDVTLPQLQANQSLLSETEFRRCRHVISENDRVRSAAEALDHHDSRRFGELMYESHASMRDDYEISCRELDIMVELARGRPGVLGARMTGGGFGGCTVNLAQRDHVADFLSMMHREYRAATGIAPEIYVCSASDGAGEISL
jgi:galactokinase